MSLPSIAQSAFGQAESILAQLGGKAPTAAGNFVGPDGHPYTLTFRAADAFESQAASREMTMHGYEDKSVMIGTATREQFDAPPTDWRRKQGTRLVPSPAATCTIASVTTDDPHHYVFVLLFR